MQTYWSQSERLDRAELVRLQERRFRSLIAYLHDQSPYYRQRFAKCGLDPDQFNGLEDLRRLPLMTKKEITDDIVSGRPDGFYQNLMVAPPEQILRWHKTSGTTGQPVRVGDTLWDWHAYGDLSAQALYAMGIRSHDTVTIPFGYGPFIGFWAYISGLEKIGATFVPAGGLGSEARLDLIQEFRATTMICTPSYALHLGELAEAQGLNLAEATAVRRVIITGEPSSPATKHRLAKMWDAQVTDRIGSAETGGIAYQCPTCGDLYHIQEDHLIPEVLDPRTGEPVGPGAEGELVVTPLHRRGMPLIRFNTGNIVRLSPRTRHPCGRNLLSLEETENGVVVRRTDMLVKVRGVLMDPIAIERTVRQFPDAGEAFQVVLERVGSLDEVTVVLETRLAADPARTEEMTRDLTHAFQRALNLRVNVRLVPLGGLRLDGNKLKRVVDRRGEGMQSGTAAERDQ